MYQSTEKTQKDSGVADEAVSKGLSAAAPIAQAANANVYLPFQPKIGLEKSKEEKESWKSWMGFRMDPSALGAFYGIFRWKGYGAQALYTKTEKYLGSVLTRDSNKAIYSFFGNNTKNLLNAVEGVAFSGLAGGFAFSELKEEHKDCALAVAAEMGRNPNQISFSDLKHSKNPIVQSEMDRYVWQNGSRLVAGLSFFYNLMVGIIANATVTTLERTVFYRPIAYDLLKKAVSDVQFNELGDKSAKDSLVSDLIKVMQATRFDHGTKTISRENIDALRPTLEKIADDVLDKRFGFKGMMYIMGGGVLIPGNPAQSMANYQHVRDVGVEGIAAERFKLKAANQNLPKPANENLPGKKVHDAEHQARGQKGYVAESARRDELRRQRQSIISRPVGTTGAPDAAQPTPAIVL